MSSAPDGTVVRRSSPRADLLAFEVTGRITKRDIEWMSSATHGEIQAHGEFDMLVIISKWDGTDLGAAFDTYAGGIMARSVAHVRRYVVVGAPRMAEAMVAIMGKVLPLETRTFDLADEPSAWAFLASSAD